VLVEQRTIAWIALNTGINPWIPSPMATKMLGGRLRECLDDIAELAGFSTR
jgi:hypothetical protein